MGVKWYIFAVCYLLLSCVVVNELAKRDCLFGVRLSKPARRTLLVFSDKKEKISIFVVAFQAYTYIMILLLLLQLIFSPHFLRPMFAAPQMIYSTALKLQLPIFVLPLTAEACIPELKEGKERRRIRKELGGEEPPRVYVLSGRGEGYRLPEPMMAELVQNHGDIPLRNAKYGDSIDWSAAAEAFGIKKPERLLLEKKPLPESVAYGTATVAGEEMLVIKAKHISEKSMKKQLERFMFHAPSNEEVLVLGMNETLMLMCPARNK